MGNGGLYGDSIEVIVISDIYEASDSVYFASEEQITQQQTTVTGKGVTERNASLLVTGELENSFYDALLRDEERERLAILDEICSHRQHPMKIFTFIHFNFN
jgi:hypothetical protein